MQVFDVFIIILIKMYHGKEDIQITEHKFELNILVSAGTIHGRKLSKFLILIFLQPDVAFDILNPEFYLLKISQA